MPLCSALTRKGTACTKMANLSHPGQLCGTHHALEVRRAEEERVQNELAAEAERIRLENVAAARNRILHENTRRQDRAPAGSPDDFFRYARLIADIWIERRVPGDMLAQAYCVIRKTSVQHASWAPFLRAVVGVLNLAFFHPDNTPWNDIEQSEKDEVFQTLTQTLEPFDKYDIIASLRVGDKVHGEAVRRRNEVAAAERAAVLAAKAAREAAAAAAQAAAEAAAQAARDAEFQLQNRVAPVVFRRDPEGGIDLRAFGRDAQSTHRSSVQDATRKAVPILIGRPVDGTQETLAEILIAFEDVTAVRFSPRAKEQCIMEITNDYYNTMAFNTPYGDILDRVWMYIKVHVECKQLIRRLAQETLDGIGMCENGKMTHLINVLYAYDAEITAIMQNEAPPREAFHAKFATLLNLAVAERAAAAVDIFNDYHIPEAEREQWLNPMLEAE